jgi:type IV secretion system protein VirD4
MEMLHYAHTPAGPLDVVGQAAMEMMNRESREQSGAISTAISFLSLYRDPVVAGNVQASDFRIRDLMQPGRPVSLYIVVPPSDRDRVRPLVRLLITVIVRRLTEEMDFAASGGERQRLLLMLDEFANLGRLEVMEESLAYLAGYGIRAYLVLQDIQQLYKTYTRDETILSHCHIRAAFAPNKLETAQWLSQQTGESTVVKEKVSTSGGRFSVMLDKVSTTYDEHKRHLLTADECMRLPAATKDASDKIVAPGDMIVLVAGEPPIYGKQPMYFLDSKLLERAQMTAPRVPDKIIQSDREAVDGDEIDQALAAC